MVIEKRFSVLLDEQREYIQALILFICDQPDVSMLKQRLSEISPEFTITQNESNLYIQWQNKQVTINVGL